MYRPLNFFAKLARRLAREERRLARRVKGSRNWLRQKAGITGLHIRIADASSDYLHKVSSAVSKNHAVVVLEELQMANMSASARGTLLAPGCRVRQKGGLNRAILDQGWGECARQLEYKSPDWAEWCSASIRRAPAKSARAAGSAPRGTGRDRRASRVFPHGLAAHADDNAALNILAAGHAVIACGEHGAAGPLDEAGTSGAAAAQAAEAPGIPVLQDGEDVN